VGCQAPQRVFHGASEGGLLGILQERLAGRFHWQGAVPDPGGQAFHEAGAVAPPVQELKDRSVPFAEV
jgi:hypothetical protein